VEGCVTLGQAQVVYKTKLTRIHDKAVFDLRGQ
jgi:hypothetical protein